MARTIDKLLQNRRRKQILEAAAECFVVNGFHQTGIKQICTASGLSAGSVYHYFKNKDAIIEGIADEFDSDTKKFFKTLNKRKNFTADFIKASKARLKETQQYVRYGRLVVEIYAESFRNEKVKKIIQDKDQLALNEMIEIIDSAIESQQISDFHDSEMLAHTLIGLIDGLENRILQYPEIKLAKLLKPFEQVCTKLLG
ncbi:hypothetical protein MNBD_GAMMA03-842 [hydrothermal vent metagenome]|uniref:HTH tetR-type domain-containing protein n=1 Tax=hydrothermal vent metagenome TaxID=652676 RepID=A0A3B0WYM8_9ZZZZ